MKQAVINIEKVSVECNVQSFKHTSRSIEAGVYGRTIFVGLFLFYVSVLPTCMCVKFTHTVYMLRI